MIGVRKIIMFFRPLSSNRNMLFNVGCGLIKVNKIKRPYIIGFVIIESIPESPQ